jgi:putative transposase
MIRTHIIRCRLNKATCDALNQASGRVYTGVLVRHWRVVRKKGVWLSEKAGTKLSDYYTDIKLHAHSIDAAQQGFYRACKTAKAVKSIDPTAKYPHRPKKFRTTVWKNTGFGRKGDVLELSTGLGNPKITIRISEPLRDALRFLEVRLVYAKKARRYNWHIVVENGHEPKPAPGSNVVSVDPGEIHPAVVGDEDSATVITCRERRAVQRAHAKNLASFSKALSRKKKGSRRYRRLMRAKTRCKAKYDLVMRDLEHKISRAIVDEAVDRKAGTIVYGDIRDIADGIDKGKVHNQRTSQWSYGKVRAYVEYKAQAEGIEVVLQDEHHTSKTCPNCGNRHKPKGRIYQCPACKFQSHRDVVGQVNILSAFKVGEPGKIPAPTNVKYRIPQNLRVMRKCRDTGQAAIPVACGAIPQEAAGL